MNSETRVTIDASSDEPVYECRESRILTALISILLLAGFVVCVYVVVAGWGVTSIPAKAILLFTAAGCIYALAEAIFTRTRFYDDRISHRSWLGQRREFEYGEVSAAIRKDGGVNLDFRDGSAVRLYRLRVDQDRVCEILQSKNPDIRILEA